MRQNLWNRGRPSPHDHWVLKTVQMTRTRLSGLSLAYFMVLLDTTILGVALPHLRHEIDADTADLTWVVNAYTITFAAALLGGGALADRLGPTRVFRVGTAGFAVMSAICAATTELWMLVGARALLGLAGAAMVPSSLAVITRIVPAGDARAKALGAWAAIAGVSIASGPLLGGVLVELWGWRAIFVVNVPIGVAVMFLTRGISLPGAPRPLFVRAQIATAAFVGALTHAVVTRSAVTLIVAVLIAAWLAAREHTAFKILGNANLVRWFGIGAATQFLFAGLLFVVSLHLQEQRGFGPVQTGLAFLPLTLPLMINPIFTTRLTGRVGARKPLLIGLPMVGVGAGILALTPEYAVMVLGLVLIGSGVTFVIPPLISAVTSAVPASSAGEATGMLNATRQVGGALGVAAMGTISAGAAFALGAVVIAVAVGCALPRGTTTG